MINLDEVTIGCDPELFVRKKTGDRSFVSAHGLIPGTKDDPHPVKDGAIQVDGMAVEFNTEPTNKGSLDFYLKTMQVMDELQKAVGDGYELVAKPWTRFGKKVWENTPEEALILGCDPDFNAYTMTANEAPDAKVDFRTAAGHLHIGWTKGMDVKDPGHLAACGILVRELDSCIGLASVLLDKQGKKRRELYGKPGCFRPKSYGVEYRTPSNFWVGDEDLTMWMYDTAISCVSDLLKGRGIAQANNDRIGERIRWAIENSDVRKATRELYNIGTNAATRTRNMLRRRGVI